MAVGWSPLGSYSDTSLKAMPPSLFSGRGGPVRHEQRQAARDQRMRGDHRLLGQHLARALGALVRLGQDGVEATPSCLEAARGRRRVAQRGEGGGRGAAGTAPAAPRRSRPRPERLVSGVPPAASAGGGGGLPDLPREGRGLGVVSETRELRVSRGDARAERVRENGASADLGGGAWGRYMARGRGGGKL